jgi:hypothetical protein
MKKLLLVLAVAAFTACKNEKKEEKTETPTTTETQPTSTEQAPAKDTAQVTPPAETTVAAPK